MRRLLMIFFIAAVFGCTTQIRDRREFPFILVMINESDLPEESERIAETISSMLHNTGEIVSITETERTLLTDYIYEDGEYFENSEDYIDNDNNLLPSDFILLLSLKYSDNTYYLSLRLIFVGNGSRILSTMLCHNNSLQSVEDQMKEWMPSFLNHAADTGFISGTKYTGIRAAAEEFSEQ